MIYNVVLVSGVQQSDLVVRIHISGASLVVQMVKNLPAMQETPVRYLSQEDPLEKGITTHSSVVAWRIP